MATTRKNKDVSGKDRPEDQAASQAAKRKPDHTIRIEDCSASIWSRSAMIQGKPQVFYSVTLERSFKNAASQWQYTKTFDPDSLAKVASLCEQASKWIGEQVTGK
jgi:hypothetical protein